MSSLREHIRCAIKEHEFTKEEFVSMINREFDYVTKQMEDEKCQE